MISLARVLLSLEMSSRRGGERGNLSFIWLLQCKVFSAGIDDVL